MKREGLRRTAPAPAPALVLMLRVMVMISFALGSASAFAETKRNDSAALAHELDRLSKTARVLYVAAHPDDENTRLLAYLANSRHLTVGYLSLTRGDGGQNLIGAEKGDLLGIIRTHELLAARSLDGAEQRFTRLRDFGYSKTPDEAFSQWGHEEALSDVVWVIRTFQPDVIITRFDETPPNHGHHIASAILAREAFTAAADPSKFPEQLKAGASIWKVERILHNFSHWRGKPPPTAMPLDVGGYDVRLGLSYGELAAVSRSQHKSQGFGALSERGELLEHFVHVAGSKPTKDLLEGVPLGWERFGAAGKAVSDAVVQAQGALTRDAPEKALPALVKVHAALQSLPEGPRKRDALASTEALIAHAAGLFVRATAEVPRVAPGEKVPVKLELVLRRPAELSLSKIAWPGADGRPATAEAIDPKDALTVGPRRIIERPVAISSDAQVSTPYWLRARSTDSALHVVPDQRLVGEPLGPAPLAVRVELTALGRAISVTVPVQFVWTDRVHGERVRTVMVAPPLTVTPVRDAVMLVNGAAGRVTLRVRAGRDAVEGQIRLPVPSGWKVSPAVQPVKVAKRGEETIVHFEVKADAKATPITVSPIAVVGEREWAFSEDLIDHPHIPVQVVFQPSELRLAPVSLKLPRGTIGYVEGSGDTLVEDLAHIGARIERINDETLRAGDLSRYSAILLGIRAYNTREVLKSAHARLMKYAEGGGTVVVQYNTSSRYDPLEQELGPFPFTLGRDRVTDERAAVTLVNPAHPLLTKPNRITGSDWEGWVQERGLYFAEKWDARYTPLLRMNDPGEAPLEGSVLVARVGKGRYLYTGLSFFRQLPAGVPGAYRLLANFIGRE